MAIIAAFDYGYRKYEIDETHFYVLDQSDNLVARYPLEQVMGHGGFDYGEYNNYTFQFSESDKIVITNDPDLTPFVEAFNKQLAIILNKKK
ncbi:hypothetical protein ACYCSE_17125 [Paenibacillus sp. SEL1]